MRRAFIYSFIVLAAVWLSPVARAQDAEALPEVATHPMDALTADEIALTAQLLKQAGAVDDKTLYAAITLLEPAKIKVLEWQEGDPTTRQAFVVFRREGRTSEARLDLTARKVISITVKPGKQPMIMDRNWVRARDAFIKDERYVAAIAKRQLKLDDVFCTPNSAGFYPEQDYDGRQVVKIPCFSSKDKCINW